VESYLYSSYTAAWHGQVLSFLIENTLKQTHKESENRKEYGPKQSAFKRNSIFTKMVQKSTHEISSSTNERLAQELRVLLTVKMQILQFALHAHGYQLRSQFKVN